jgi:predicted AAA+ superfamily ATPase
MNTITVNKDKVANIRVALCSLSIYRGVLEDSLLVKLRNLLDCICGENFEPVKALELYSRFAYEFMNCKPLKCFKSYIIDKIIFNENQFSLQAEHKEFESIDTVIKSAAAADLDLLQIVSELTSEDIKSSLIECCSLQDYDTHIFKNLPSWDFEKTPVFSPASSENCIDSIRKVLFYSGNWRNCIEYLSDFHRKWGCGIFARYKAFIWERSGNSCCLKGIENPDPISLSDLISYHDERTEVINNTLMFIKGYPANNILLYGDRGTGKSSTIKAIMNEYYNSGLRIIEVPKKYLIDFPHIVHMLKNRSLKFILFVDDLSFEDSGENYTALKAVLEGSLEVRPSNVLIYATSNRRHLIKEKFSDRSGLQSGNLDDEIRAADTVQEKLSLSDRFGMTIVFSSPDKSGYLQIVEGIAAKRGLKLDKDFLHREALKWEMWYNGRSPRTAKQFVDWLEGYIKMGLNNN